jgi:uncharacterized protein (TIGR02246 family)
MATYTKDARSDEEARAIRAVSADWLGAVGARDAAAAARVYAEDGVLLIPHAPPARGRDAVRAGWETLLQIPGLALEWEASTIEVARSGDLACEIGSYRLGMDGPRGRVDDEGKYVVVWRRSGNQWRVAADIFNSNTPLPSMTPDRAATLARQLVHFLETGDVPEGLFAPDVFCDFTMPTWRLQSRGIDGLVALRGQGHPGPGTVPRWRCDPTETGFVLEVEERWTDGGTDWYSREMFRADVTGGNIGSLSVYCTGDWDAGRRAEHARTVELLRP